MIVDPSPVRESAAYNHPIFYYLPQIQKVGKTFDRAMEEVDPAWNGDIYDWNPIFPFYIPKKHLTGNTYFFLPQHPFLYINKLKYEIF